MCRPRQTPLASPQLIGIHGSPMGRVRELDGLDSPKERRQRVSTGCTGAALILMSLQSQHTEGLPGILAGFDSGWRLSQGGLNFVRDAIS